MLLEVSVRIRYMHEDKGVKVAKLIKLFPKYSKSNIYLHAKYPVHIVKDDRHSKNMGQPRLLTERDKRSLILAISYLCDSVGSFSAKRLKVEAGIDPKISDLTVRRLLNREGYKYLQSRKKGLMSRKDIKACVKFAHKVKRLLPQSIWTEGISFYLDGTSYAHKTNPYDQARSTKSMAWRKTCEGLSSKCTSKGKKAGTGGKMVHFIVAIAYNRGVVLCEQYQDRFTGDYFANFIKEHFNEAFSTSPNPEGKLFLQDGDPRQNSAPARKEMSEIGARLFAIPPR